MKIGDLSQSGISFSGDKPQEMMDVDEIDLLPEGTEIGSQSQLSKGEERSLLRDSTAGFAGTVYLHFGSYFGRLFPSSFRLGGSVIPPCPCSF